MKRILQIFSNRMRLAALAAGLLCAAAIAPAALHAQSVYFAGTPTVTLGGGFNEPQGVAVDAGGNVYVADVNHSAVKEIPANCIAGANNASCVLTLGGGFNTPTGVAVDGSGNVFVADYDNGAVKEIPANCIAGANNASCVLTLGGGFSYPEGVAVDGSGNVFVADLFEPSVQEISANCIAGANNASCVQTLGGGFAGPTGVAVDGNGNVFVADLFDASVKEIPANCIAGANNASCVRTLGGGFASPAGVTVDGSGDVFVADDVAPPTFGEAYEIPASCIAGANNANCVRTLGGAFVEPKGVAVDAKGDLFVGDVQSDSVVEFQAQSVNFGSANVCPAGQTTPAPCSQTIALNYNVTASGTLGTPQVLTSGTPNLDFTLAGGSTCTGSVTAGSTCTVNVTFAPRLAGARNGAVQILDSNGNVLATSLVYGVGVGPQIAFSPAAQSTVGSGLNSPVGVAVDGAGDVFIADQGNQRVEEVTPGGVQTTLPASGLYLPFGVAVDGAGDVFIADYAKGHVVEVTPGGVQTTVPATGLGLASGVAVDGRGDVFITDIQNNNVVEVTPLGVQTTVPASGLDHPYGVAVDGAGDVFIADGFNNRVVKVTPGGVQTTVGNGLSYPYGVAVDGVGDVFIADEGDGGGVEVTPGGVQTTLPASGLSSPYALAVDGSGNVYIADTGNNRVVKLNISTPPALAFATTPVGQTSSDSPQSVTIQNIGNASLSLTGLSIAANFGQVDGSGNPEDCTSSLSLAAGASCNLSLSFTPTTAGAIQGSAVLTDNALNASPATQTIALSGTGTQANQTITFGQIATQTAGTSINLIATASSGLAVSFISETTNVCTVSGTTASLIASGSCTIEATQAGNANYAPATPVTQTFTVNKEAQTITFSPIATQTAGTSINLTATASSGLAVSFISETTNVCAVSGTTASLIASGTCTIEATQAGNATYAPATPVARSFTVSAPANFTLTPIPPRETVYRGVLGVFLLELRSVQDFKGKVKLSCSGGPTGDVCVDFPQTVTLSPDGTAYALTGILFPRNAVPGTYTITFTGVSGSLTNTATAKFTVK
jgi:sugar lactone lactonase YvrE